MEGRANARRRIERGIMIGDSGKEVKDLEKDGKQAQK